MIGPFTAIPSICNQRSLSYPNSSQVSAFVDFICDPHIGRHTRDTEMISQKFDIAQAVKSSLKQPTRPMLLAYFSPADFCKFCVGGLLMPKGKLRTKQCANHLSRYNNFAMLATHIGGQKILFSAHIIFTIIHPSHL